MKKLIYFFMVSILMLAVGCSTQRVEAPEIIGENPVEIVEEVKVNTGLPFKMLSYGYSEESNSIEYTIQNTSEDIIEHGAMYEIQMETKDEVWENTEYSNNLAFDMMMRMVSPTEQTKESFDVSVFSKTPGKYRIIKQYTCGENSYTIYSYFVVTEEGTYENLTLDIK